MSQQDTKEFSQSANQEPVSNIQILGGIVLHFRGVRDLGITKVITQIGNYFIYLILIVNVAVVSGTLL